MSKITHYREHELLLTKIATDRCSGENKGGCKEWLRKAIQLRSDESRSVKNCSATLMTYILEWMRPKPGMEDKPFPTRYSGQRLILHRRTVQEDLNICRSSYQRALNNLRKIRAIISEGHQMGTMIKLDLEGFSELLATGLAESSLSAQAQQKDIDKFRDNLSHIRSTYPDVAVAYDNLAVANESFLAT